MKILHVDDNKIFTDVFSKLLELYDHTCDVSNDGKDALQLAISNKYDAIVLDLEIPEYSGRDFIDELEKLNLLSSQKIIILTGFLPPSEDVDAFLQRGIVTCLEKPVPIEKFNEILTQLLIDSPTA